MSPRALNSYLLAIGIVCFVNIPSVRAGDELAPVLPAIAKCVGALISPDQLSHAIRQSDIVKVPRGDNAGFVDFIETAEKTGLQDHFVLHLEFSAKKELNNPRYLGFDPTTEATSLFQSIALKLLKENPNYKTILEHVDLGKVYVDDKSIRFIVGTRDVGVRTKVREYAVNVSNEFGRRMRDFGFQSTSASWTGRRGDFLQSPEKWIVSGAGNTWQQADIASGVSRSAVAHGVQFCDFNLKLDGEIDVAKVLWDRLKETRQLRDDLKKRTDLRMVGITRTEYSGKSPLQVISEESYAILRSFQPTHRDLYFEELQKAFQKVFGPDVTKEDVKALHGMYSRVDQYFKTGLLKRAAPRLPSFDRKHGFIASDAVGVGAMNLNQVDRAALSVESEVLAKDGSLQVMQDASRLLIERVEAGMSRVTEHLGVEKQADEGAIRSQGWSSDPVVVHATGDDLLYNLPRRISQYEAEVWLGARMRDTHSLPSKKRLVWCDGGAASHVDLGHLRDEGMEVQKRLRNLFPDKNIGILVAFREWNLAGEMPSLNLYIWGERPLGTTELWVERWLNLQKVIHPTDFRWGSVKVLK